MKFISLSHLFGAALVAQLLCLQPLWGHQSTSAAFLGRYSARYGFALMASAVLLVLWLLALLFRHRVGDRLQRLPDRLRYALILGGGLVTGGLWLTSIEPILQNYFAVNWVFVTLILLWTQPDTIVLTHRWRWLVAAGLLLLALPVAVTVFTALPYSPDEAHWADLGTNYFVNGGAYPRTWLEEPRVIKPGVGWSVVAYGWVLENIAFTYRTGRIWNLMSFAAAYAGIGLVAARLYGRKAAYASVVFALLSQVFLQRLDYRPDHQLPAVSMLIMLAALQARYGRQARFWHWAAGLLATLGMQFHAASIVCAFGFSLFYLLEFIWQMYRQRRWQVFEPVLWFGLGAALGSGVYYLLNIQAVGGLETFVTVLVDDRWSLERNFTFLHWSYLFESILVWGGFAYILWRRNPRDRLFLGILVCQLIGSALLDTQGGYYTVFAAFYMIPVGVLLVQGLRTADMPDGQSRRSVLAQVAVAFVLIGLVMVSVVDRSGIRDFLRAGQIPPSVNEQLGQALRPYTSSDDVIFSTHELFWEFHQPTDQLISMGGEIYGTRRWNLDNSLELWRMLQPTVVIYIERRMVIPETLWVYMDESGFQTCDVLTAAGLNITIYREDCTAHVKPAA